MDCDKVDKGCFGGDMGQAYDWIKENGGVCTEEEYPYAGLWPPFKTCATACTPVEGTEVCRASCFFGLTVVHTWYFSRRGPRPSNTAGICRGWWGILVLL